MAEDVLLRSPTRPHTSSRRPSSSAAGVMSPRRSAPSPRQQQQTQTPRSQSASATRASASLPLSHRSSQPSERQPVRSTALQSPRAFNDLLAINPRAREHVEVTACMLAYRHSIDVNALERVRTQAQQAVERARVTKFVTQSGLLHDGSDVATLRCKTSFLLRHWFALDDTTSTPQQERLLYDVVEDWQCRDDAASDAIASVWASVTRHIEQSYILRRKLVSHTDPDRVSVRIALDCLHQLASHLPSYARVVDVALRVLESALVVKPNSNSHDSVSTDDTVEQPPQPQQFYFEACDALEHALATARMQSTQAAAANAQLGSTPNTIREQIDRWLLQLRDDDIDAPLALESLFLALLRRRPDVLASLALVEALPIVFANPNVEKRREFYALWLPLLRNDEPLYALEALAGAHRSAFQRFLLEHFDALVLDDKASSVSSGTTAAVETRASHALFHRLIERHPSAFAAILWQSPFLTAQVFQDSHGLVARIIEQNIFLVSQVLRQRADVLLSLLTHTLKDSTAVLEEFLVAHPRSFTDLLVSRPALLAGAVKANDAILNELLLSCRSTFANVLLAMPGTLSAIVRLHPELLASLVRDDPTLLATAFTLVPHALSETLEQHPELFLDVAHRRPVLVTRLFATHPDLLMAPLEANPTLFSNFLVYHRNVLPDLAAPTFDPMLFQLESKKFAAVGAQTTRTIAAFETPKRIGARIERYEAEMRVVARAAAEHARAFEVAATAAAAAAASPPRRLTRLNSQRMLAIGAAAAGLQRMDSSIAMGLERKDSTTTTVSSQNASVSHDTVSNNSSVGSTAALNNPSVATALLTPTDVVYEIARLYVRKIDADALADASQHTRQDFVPFIHDTYLVDTGFKSRAHTKLAQLVGSATRATGHAQETMRITWFLRFIHVNAAAPTTKLRLHRVALDFYLRALQQLIPREQLATRLEHEPYAACLVPYAALTDLVDDPLVSRLLLSKEQRQQLLRLQVSARDTLLGGATATSAGVAVASGVAMAGSARRRDTMLLPQLQRSQSTLTMLHVDDVLDSTMNVWLQYQARVREEWSALFQRVDADGSGVVHYSAFTALVRSKLAFVDDRQLLKTFHQCGEENELGEFALLLEDFTLAMFVLQEQDDLRQFALPS